MNGRWRHGLKSSHWGCEQEVGRRWLRLEHWRAFKKRTDLEVPGKKKKWLQRGSQKWKDTIKSGDSCSSGSTHSLQKDSDYLPISLKEQEEVGRGGWQKQGLTSYLSHPAIDAKKMRQKHNLFLGCFRNKMTLSPPPQYKLQTVTEQTLPLGFPSEALRHRMLCPIWAALGAAPGVVQRQPGERAHLSPEE